jgi:hypothetical protein
VWNAIEQERHVKSDPRSMLSVVVVVAVAVAMLLVNVSIEKIVFKGECGKAPV